jgi:hypothetical protein
VFRDNHPSSFFVMMEEALTGHNPGEPIKRDICPRCKKVYISDSVLCAPCSKSPAQYLGSHPHKPPNWFVKKLSQFINADRLLHWCPCCHTLHGGESQLCDVCKQQIGADKLQCWLDKVRQKRTNRMKRRPNVGDNSSDESGSKKYRDEGIAH